MATNAPVVVRPDPVNTPLGPVQPMDVLVPAEQMQGNWKATARRLWLWPLAVLVGFPLAGYIADLIVNGVDSVGTALAGGLVAGVIIGAAGWYVLRGRVSWLWIRPQR